MIMFGQPARRRRRRRRLQHLVNCGLINRGFISCGLTPRQTARWGIAHFEDPMVAHLGDRASPGELTVE